MLKMFHSASSPDAPAFWEERWSDGRLDEAIRFCEIDPLRTIFETWLRPGARVLEGGCGRGQYVVYYGQRGSWVLGLDFAASTLTALKRRFPSTPACVGDVFRLPLASDSFDVYFSGGVVEHFEPGPLPALREAHRILRRGGVFLVTVPYLSPLRRMSVLWRRDRRLTTTMKEKLSERQPARFWQYAFGVEEFTRLLANAGFAVSLTQPYAILHGLEELPLVSRLSSVIPIRRRQPSDPAASRAPVTGSARAATITRALKRVLVAEDQALPVVGPLIAAAASLSANMMMYVCRKTDG